MPTTTSRTARGPLPVVCLLVALLLVACTPGRPGPGGDPSSGSPVTSTSSSPSADDAEENPDRPDPTVPDVRPEGFVDPPAGSGLQRYAGQTPAWVPCETYQCATVAVPLDHGDPDGQAITLSLLKVPATAEPRLGTLFVNPGGPGYGGTGTAKDLSRAGLEQYDVVGWDPRGVGGSTPVRCFQGEDVDSYVALDTSPDDTAERQALVVANRSFGQSCLERSGVLLEHISTLDTVRDLDLLRQMVGDERLSYLGYSYGTYIGSVYAELFPSRVGRLVLDSAVNITEDEDVTQAVGFDRALTSFADWCVSQGCQLGGTREEVLERVTTVFDATDVQPMPTRSERRLTQSLAVTGVVVLLYSEESWPQLREALELAADGDGDALLFYADAYNERGQDGQYGQSTFAFPAISCVDEDDEGLDRALEDWESDEEVAPVFGRYFGPALTCPVWPATPTVLEEPIRGAGAEPILVVGTTGDSATPYEYAVSMADQLESGRLLTLEGEGHGAFGDGNACVDEAVVGYLVEGTLPPEGTRCRE